MISTLSSTCLWIIVFVIVALLFIMLRQPKSGYNRGGAGGMTLFVDLEGQKHAVDVTPDATAKDLLEQLANQLGRTNPLTARNCRWTNKHSCKIFGNPVGTSGKYARDDGTPGFIECCRNRLFYDYQLEFGGQKVPLSVTLSDFGIPAEATLSLNSNRPDSFKMIIKDHLEWEVGSSYTMEVWTCNIIGFDIYNDDGDDMPWVFTIYAKGLRFGKLDNQTLILMYPETDEHSFTISPRNHVSTLNFDAHLAKIKTFFTDSPENHSFFEGLRNARKVEIHQQMAIGITVKQQPYFRTP